MSQKQKRASRSAWPPIYRRTHRSGQVGYMVDLGKVNGKRDRRTFPTKQAAETFAAKARVNKANEGTAAFALSADSRVEASKCLLKLKPWNATVTEAVDYYIEHVLRYRDAPIITGIADRMIEDAKSAGRRNWTICDLKTRLHQFSLTFGKRQLSTITLAELEQWLNRPDLSARSRINRATKVSQLFNFAIRHGWADSNLVERIPRPVAEDKEPGIFTVKQAAALLAVTPKFGLLPYVALGLFAGLRPAETERLDWSAVKLEERSIIIGAEIAKKRSRRVVEINDTLTAWITPYMKEKGPVVDRVNLRKRLNSLTEKAKVDWPINGLRHSFGSYHLGAFGDAAKTAAQMGHRDSSVLHNHYKALVTRGEAEEFWKLRPKKTRPKKLKKAVA